MKRALVSLLMILAVGLARAENPRYTIDSNIGPAVVTTTTTPQVSIAAAGAGKRNCLTYVIANSTNTYTLRVLDGNTTSYQVTMGASAKTSDLFGVTNPFCGTANTAMSISLTMGVAATTTMEVNYSGFVGR